MLNCSGQPPLLEIDYTLISAPQTGERGTMDHTYRHLSSGLDSDSAKDTFCDSSLSLSVWYDDDVLQTIDPNFSCVVSMLRHCFYLLFTRVQDDTRRHGSYVVSDNKPLTDN